MSERVLRVGMLGCGTVGAAVIRLLERHRDDIERRAGCRLEVRRVAVRDASKPRDVGLPQSAFVEDPMAVVDDPDVDIVVEVIGGIEPARSLILEALKARQARRHRQQGAARHARHASCSTPPTRRGVDLLSRRRWPAASR